MLNIFETLKREPAPAANPAKPLCFCMFLKSKQIYSRFTGVAGRLETVMHPWGLERSPDFVGFGDETPPGPQNIIFQCFSAFLYVFGVPGGVINGPFVDKKSVFREKVGPSFLNDSTAF